MRFIYIPTAYRFLALDRENINVLAKSVLYTCEYEHKMFDKFKIFENLNFKKTVTSVNSSPFEVIPVGDLR